MSPLCHDLLILQGATFDQVFTWKLRRPDQTRRGCREDSATPVDLTGCEARLQVREKISSPDLLLELTTQNGGIVLGGETGRIQFLIPAEQTALMTWKKGVYDLEIIHPNGHVRRLLAGAASLSPGVTRDQ